MNFYGIEKENRSGNRLLRGIGRAIALAFGRAGYNVVLNASKSAAQLEGTKSLLESEAIPVLAVLADVSDYEGCKLLFAKIEETFGMVDVLVNNAGISHIGLFTDMTPANGTMCWMSTLVRC